MAFETYPVDAGHSYEGLYVGAKAMNITVPVSRKMDTLGYKYVRVEYDKEEGLIKLAKATEGHKFNFGLVQAKIARIMPIGRYKLVKGGAKEFLFKKII